MQPSYRQEHTSVPHRLTSPAPHNTYSKTRVSLVSGFLFHHGIFHANVHSLSGAFDHVVMQIMWQFHFWFSEDPSY